MERAQPSHHDGGLHRVLNRAGVYGALQKLLLRSGSRERYVREFVRPFPGCRILDIGCGPGDILEYLPESVGAYAGFDMNPGYIEAAQQRWIHAPFAPMIAPPNARPPLPSRKWSRAPR